MPKTVTPQPMPLTSEPGRQQMTHPSLVQVGMITDRPMPVNPGKPAGEK